MLSAELASDNNHQPSPFRMDGKVALVTGGAGGIGRAAAILLAASGATVAIADLPVAIQRENGLGDYQSSTVFAAYELDVTSESSCEEVVSQVVEANGHLDILVNCAGINAHSPSATLNIAEWVAVIDINLTGTFRMMKAAYVALEQSGNGSIVNLTSTAGQVSVPENIHYSVSKAGIIRLTSTLAFEWASVGIRVNAVGPTIVSTAMTEHLRADHDYMTEKLQSIPLGRMATVDDVAAAICFLASPGAGMVTGQTLFVDGGVTTR